jgi:hypothetical protein
MKHRKKGEYNGGRTLRKCVPWATVPHPPSCVNILCHLRTRPEPIPLYLLWHTPCQNFRPLLLPLSLSIKEGKQNYVAMDKPDGPSSAWRLAIDHGITTMNHGVEGEDNDWDCSVWFWDETLLKTRRWMNWLRSDVWHGGACPPLVVAVQFQWSTVLVDWCTAMD